jgi:hypothetical protein
MNPKVATILKEIRCSDKFKPLACLCPPEIWAEAIKLVSEFNLRELDLIHSALCDKFCPPKGEGGQVVNYVPVLPPPPPIIEPKPVEPTPVVCSTDPPAPGARR